MAVTVEIRNLAKLRKARTILGARSNNETLELALDKVIDSGRINGPETQSPELPDSFWDDLFSQRPILPAGSTSKAVTDDRDEAPY